MWAQTGLAAEVPETVPLPLLQGWILCCPPKLPCQGYVVKNSDLEPCRGVKDSSMKISEGYCRGVNFCGDCPWPVFVDT